MNCQSLLENIGYGCQDLGSGTLRLWSPFTYGRDGEVIGLYVEKTGSGYRITDNAEALMHAYSLGINLTTRRVDAIRRAAPFAEISQGGAITATVATEDLTEGIASVLSASLAVGHFEGMWKPRLRSDSFIRQVGEVLEERLGAARLEREVKVTGASGHQLEIPFVIANAAERIFVQPVASNEDSVDWNGVYEGFGKMMDLRDAEAADTSRLVVIESRQDDREQAKAITLLSRAARVVDFANLPAWATRLAA